MVQDEVGKKLRRQRHHARCFGATIAPSVRDAVKPVGSRLPDPRHYSGQRVQKQIDALAYGKPCGPEMIMVELIKAAGAIYTWFLYTLANATSTFQYVAAQWSGGRICT